MIHSNAATLYDEAQTLGQAGAFARAAALHQVPMEECSKVDTLGAVVVSLIAGRQVDDASLARDFRDHRAKNFENAYNAEPTEQERRARETRDWEAPDAAFKKFQSDFHKVVNDVKNAGLYLDYKSGIFSALVDIVKEATTVSLMHLNSDFLRRGEEYIHLLKRIESDPERHAKVLTTPLSSTASMKLKDGLSTEAVVEVVFGQMRAQMEKIR